MVKLDFRQFFDRKAVTDKVKDSSRGVLSRAGAFVRRTARGMIRKRNRVSGPGEPPSGHVGTLKRLIFFGYDESTDSVVVGPTPFRNASGGTDGAALLELGGKTRRDGETLTYEARPVMFPALEQEAPKFPDLFRDSVR